jgi:hypothetical protein
MRRAKTTTAAAQASRTRTHVAGAGTEQYVPVDESTWPQPSPVDKAIIILSTTLPPEQRTVLDGPKPSMARVASAATTTSKPIRTIRRRDFDREGTPGIMALDFSQSTPLARERMACPFPTGDAPSCLRRAAGHASLYTTPTFALLRSRDKRRRGAPTPHQCAGVSVPGSCALNDPRPRARCRGARESGRRVVPRRVRDVSNPE